MGRIMSRMNTIGIENNLDRARIRKLLAIGLLGMFGLFIEGLSFFGVWRLMADAASRLAHTYRSGIFFYLWLAPVGCHMNVGLLNYAYKQLWLVSPEAAHAAVTPMYCAFWPVLVIAHRMRTVMGADKIVVLEDGHVVERGSPAGLLAAKGTFTHMAELQGVSAGWPI